MEARDMILFELRFGSMRFGTGPEVRVLCLLRDTSHFYHKGHLARRILINFWQNRHIQLSHVVSLLIWH